MRPTTILLALLTLAPLSATAAPAHLTSTQHIIFDTDIGDDIDDAYALALLLQSPGIHIDGITTAFGDTQLRARLVTHLLQQSGHAAIPVYAGPKTRPATTFTQSAYAEQSPARTYPDAIAFMQSDIRQHPGQVTLVAVAPFTNLGALIRKDPATSRKLKRVVLMGGSIRNGYSDNNQPTPPSPEWNILNDIPSAQALFNSGVPLFVLPLDSTQIPLNPARREALFTHASPLTTALHQLTEEWSASTHRDTPILFDAVAAAYSVNPSICPATPMHIEVDSQGYTRETPGAPNAQVCLTSDEDTFFNSYLPTLLH